jgi:hypothetical protein
MQTIDVSIVTSSYQYYFLAVESDHLLHHVKNTNMCVQNIKPPRSEGHMGANFEAILLKVSED